MMTGAGRLLGGRVESKDGMAAALKKVLADYAALPEAERKTGKVEGEIKAQLPPPAGGLVLTIYDRPLGRPEPGRLRIPEGKDLGGHRTDAPSGQRSSLWLTAEECASLIPSEAKKGQTLPFPATLAKRIWLYGLVPQSLWVVEGLWRPDSVREGSLKLTVEEVSAKSIRLRVHGSVVMVGVSGHEFQGLEKKYDARIEGRIDVDRKANKIVRFDLVALGDYTGEWFAGHERWKAATPEAPLAQAFAFEIDRTAYELPPERRRPRGFMHAYVFNEREKFYWDPDQWKDDWEKRGKR